MNKNKIQLIEENEFYVFFEINQINKTLPNLNDNNFKNIDDGLAKLDSFLN